MRAGSQHRGNRQVINDARMGGGPGPAVRFLDAALGGRITDDLLRDWWRGRPKGTDQ